MRLVDADALIQKHGMDVTNWGNPCAVYISSIENAPTVDAVEVVHGRWIMDDYTHRYRCSICEAYQPYDNVNDCIDYWDCDYCPLCGAKMDAKE